MSLAIGSGEPVEGYEPGTVTIICLAGCLETVIDSPAQSGPANIESIRSFCKRQPDRGALNLIRRALDATGCVTRLGHDSEYSATSTDCGDAQVDCRT